MSQFSGRQYRGAMRERRAEKRAEAEARNEQTPMGRRRAIRLEAASKEVANTSRRTRVRRGGSNA